MKNTGKKVRQTTSKKVKSKGGGQPRGRRSRSIWTVNGKGGGGASAGT